MNLSRKIRSYSILSVIITFIICIANCAVQGPPSGGPVDTIAPMIVSVFPTADTTGVPLDTEISILFSERMERPSVENAVFISPPPSSRPALSWKGELFIIKFDSLLIADRTYVITIGSDAQDLRRNKMEQSFNLAFSTGEKLDEGRVSGKVYSAEKSSGVLVWAYELNERRIPNPIRHRPDYVTQTGENGEFTLSYIKNGLYRIFLIEDSNQDKLYNTFADRIAFPSGDITIAATENQFPLTFQPVKYDTIAPRIYEIEPVNNRTVVLRFTEEPVWDSVKGGIRILDMGSGDLLPEEAIKAAYFKPENRREIYIYTDALAAGREYQIEANGISDNVGNSVTAYRDSLTIFSTSADPDTQKFTLTSIYPIDSSKGISLYSEIRLTFSSPVDRSMIGNRIKISDSLGIDVNTTVEEISPVEYVLLPQKGTFNPLMEYTILLEPDSIYNLNGASLTDTKNHYIFATHDKNLTADLIGTIVLSGDSLDTPLIIQIIPENENGDFREIIIPQPGKFTVPGLSPGNYRLYTFADLNSDGRWNPGGLRPPKMAEPFVFFEGDIAIRAGIDNIISTPITLPVR
ncbi:Ig-like domain-containing protein [candidate division KSB1 bacterium]